MAGDPPSRPAAAPPSAGGLRTGFTTGACAAAAAAAAAQALATGAAPTQAAIRLPKGQTPVFDIDALRMGPAPGPTSDVAAAWARLWAEASVIKDAGDDPDVTHGARITVRLTPLEQGAGLRFLAGDGVGHVTKPGLPIPVGGPAINPGPRLMIDDAVSGVAAAHGLPCDLAIEISVPGGARLAEKTWNPRLGIVGGLSILGTTGIVRPFSCAAWIASIHRGIDVARESGAAHVAGSTGATSERIVQGLHRLPDHAMLDMGDFAGGLLKYLRTHHGGVIKQITLAGGFAKMTKLGQGALDLHSGRSQVDFAALGDLAARSCPGRPGVAALVAGCNTAAEALEKCGAPLAEAVAEMAQASARSALDGAPVALEVLIVDRMGVPVAQTGFDGG